MFLARYDNDKGETEFAIYYKNRYGYKQFFEDTFSPLNENIEVLDLKVSGKTYSERKSNLYDLAIDYQYNFSSLSWSYGELFEICNFFEKNGKRYGMLKEFKENAIC